MDAIRRSRNRCKALYSHRRYLILLLIVGFHSTARTAVFDESRPAVYLFTSFEEPADKGLRFLYSHDGLGWNRVPGEFLKPQVGSGKLMRDPSLVRGPDGWFHLVWTTAWRGDNGFGYARSRDLVQWSPQRFVPVMQHEPTTVNVWAPEVFYDEAGRRFIICWASTIPGRYPDGEEARDNNHRMFCTTTSDFESFTPTELFCEPGFSVIDATIVPYDGRYRLVLKDNTRPVRALRVAESESPLGPWKDVSPPFTAHLTEGPTVAKIGDEWVIYYDSYGEQRYGVARTKDFKTFRDASSEASFPAGHKHGTVIEITQKELDNLLQEGKERPILGNGEELESHRTDAGLGTAPSGASTTPISESNHSTHRAP